MKNEIEKKDLKELKKIGNQLKPTFIIGKNKITETFIKEIDLYLKSNKIVKIKDNNSPDKKNREKNFEKLKKELNAKEICKKGFTIVLYRE